MTQFYGLDLEKIRSLLFQETPKLKYVITDDPVEFVNRLEQIAETAHKELKDNLRYLEQKDKIRDIKNGAKIEDVFPWIKDCNHL